MLSTLFCRHDIFYRLLGVQRLRKLKWSLSRMSENAQVTIDDDLNGITNAAVTQLDNITLPIVYDGPAVLSYLNSQVKYDRSPILDSTHFANYMRNKLTTKMAMDMAFLQSVEVREIRRNNAKSLKKLESNMANSKFALSNHPNYKELVMLDKDIEGGSQAIESIGKLVSRTDLLPENTTTRISNQTATKSNIISERYMTTEKIQLFKHDILPQKILDIESKRKRREELRNQTPEYLAYQQSIHEANNFYKAIGLFSAIEASTELQLGSGTKLVNIGKGFEESSFLLVQKYLVPHLAQKYNINVDDIFVLTNVKFGIASIKGSTGEFDCIVCAKSAFPIRLHGKRKKGRRFCKVLGVVETKRNPEDIGDAFITYQRPLAWLGGFHHSYVAEDWKSRARPSGHFADKTFSIKYDNELMMFSTESFSHFNRRLVPLDERIVGMEAFQEDGMVEQIGIDKVSYRLFVDNLYFVTKPGAIEGVSSRAQSWAMSKIASSPEFDRQLTDSKALERLRLAFLMRYPYRLSTLEVLDIYTRFNLKNQIYLIGKP